MEKTTHHKSVLIGFFIVCASMLVIKAAQLQVFDKKYREQAQRATLDKKVLHPIRGLLYDRNEELMVRNTPIYDIQAIYRNVKDIDTSLFCQLLDIDHPTFLSNLNKDWSKPHFHKSVPFSFLSKVKPDKFAFFQEHLYKFPGFYPMVKNVRSYPHTNAANVMGYLGEVNQKTIDESENVYGLGDYIGITGLEKMYEHELRGRKGVSFVLKDNLGREVGMYEKGNLDSVAIAGEDIITSLDLELQGLAEKLMGNKRGAIVAIEPATGEILAMVTSPTFDPNLITIDKKRGAVFDSLLRDTINRPLLDRSTNALYPPGSIFKPILALIAMQKGVLYPDKTIYCDGTYELDRRGRSVQKCHGHPTPYNVPIALQHSCNSYFFQTMRDMVNIGGYNKPGIGLDTLVNNLRDFGLGAKLGIDLPYELSGSIPDSKFYNKVYKKVTNGWRATYILSVGIGQGELQVTTVQMANLAAIIANRGYYYTPHLIKKYKSGKSIPTQFTTQKRVRIDKQHFVPVIDGLELAVSAGTASSGYMPGLTICGKTGTSENPFGKDHSVFFGFAPKYNPKIAIAVYVENAGWGGTVATPIASLLIEKYINGEISTGRKYLEDRILNLDLINPKPGL